MTVRVPVGISLAEAIALAGGARSADPVVLNGGAMMGSVVQNLDDPVTKTTKMLLVLPRNHYLSNLRLQTQAHVRAPGQRRPVTSASCAPISVPAMRWGTPSSRTS